MADLGQFPYVLANGVGQVPDADQVMADLQHLRTYVNGALDADNLAAGTVPSARLAGAVDTPALASNAVTTAKITDANVTDAKLASPNNSVYRSLTSCSVSAAGLTVGGGPYFVSIASGVIGAAGNVSGMSGNVPMGIFDFASGDFTSALTTRFRVRAQVFVGATSPSTVTFTPGLYPLTLSAGDYVPGTVVTGSTDASATPILATNTISRYDSGDFASSALLSDPGTYVLGFAVGSITVPASISIAIQLQMRHT